MSGKITRRKAIQQSGIAIGAAAVGSVVLGSGQAVAAPVPDVTRGAVAGFRDYAAVNDITFAIRNWYPNRCPVLTRFKWVEVERCDFQMFDHRYPPLSRDPGRCWSHGSASTQWCQEFRMPVPVGESRRMVPGLPCPAAFHSTLDFNMTCQLQNLVDDVESSIYYGTVRPRRTGRDMVEQAPKMAGFKDLIKTNRKRVDPPLQADVWTGYGFDDFKRDTVGACERHGGKPDLLLMSSNMWGVFAKRVWGHLELVSPGSTALGSPILVFRHDDLPGVSIIDAPLLVPYSAIALQSREVFVRNRVNPHWRPYADGSALTIDDQIREVIEPEFRAQPDGYAGEWLCDLAIEVDNEHHHAFVGG